MRVEHYRRVKRHLDAAERRIELTLRIIVYLGIAYMIGRIVEWIGR